MDSATIEVDGKKEDFCASVVIKSLISDIVTETEKSAKLSESASLNSCDEISKIANNDGDSMNEFPSLSKPSVGGMVMDSDENSGAFESKALEPNDKDSGFGDNEIDDSTADISKPLFEETVIDSEEISETSGSTPVNSRNKVSETLEDDDENSFLVIDIGEPLINGTAIDSGKLTATSVSLELDSCDELPAAVSDGSDVPAAGIDKSSVSEIDADSEEIPGTSESVPSDSCDKVSETDGNCESNTNLEADTSDSSPIKKKRAGSERSSLPYYYQPKPEFYEYTRRLHEKLNPRPSVGNQHNANHQSVPKNSNDAVALEEASTPAYVEPSQTEVLTPVEISRNVASFSNFRNQTREIGLSPGSNSLLLSEETVPDLIILDDYEVPKDMKKTNSTGFPRFKGPWAPSNFQTTKETAEASPGSKYVALKEQLMEKIMLKKEASFKRRMEEEEEQVDEEEAYLADVAQETDGDDTSDEDYPENTVELPPLNDPMTLSDDLSNESKDIYFSETSETERLNNTKSTTGDSQPMECFSLPSYQPGGGFASCLSVGENAKSQCSDMDEVLDEHSQLKSMVNSELRNVNDEQMFSGSDDEREVIPHWEPLPSDERPNSQTFEDDVSYICSGNFSSTNEDIPWTPTTNSTFLNETRNKATMSSPAFNLHSKHDGDELNESSDEELVRPAKKLKLSLGEKLWDSDDEDETGKDPETNNLDTDLEDNKHADLQDNNKHDEDDDKKESDSDEDVTEEFSKDLFDMETSVEHVNNGYGKETKKKKVLNEFFENEAELSGEECSSDENEEEGDEYLEDALFTKDVPASDEKLRKQLGAIHFKRQQDEDDQIIRQLKNDFLPEGELYSENGTRKRKFLWNNVGEFDDQVAETKSDSEEDDSETVHTDYLKWQQEKSKTDLPEGDKEGVEMSKSISLKVDIIGKVSVTQCKSVSNSKLSTVQRRGSFLNSSFAKNSKFIKEFSSSLGAVSRKNFVFSSPKPDSAHPSASAMAETKNSKNNSIFNKI